MPLLIKNIRQLLSCKNNSPAPKKGKELSNIGLLKNTCLLIDKGKIVFIGKEQSLLKFLKKNPVKSLKEIDASGKVVMPGFIDSHTHFVFAGSRENEYEMRIAGATYEQIAKAGGGIICTVDAVRKTPKEKLKELASERLKYFAQNGTTTLEAKSGYGLNTRNEIKTLQVINELNKKNPYKLDIIPTFLGAHAVPRGITKKDYIDEIIYNMIPEVAKKKLAYFIDAFCEKGYFDENETNKILSEGRKFGLIPKLHTDQFHSIGGVKAAIKNSAISVDHLEALKDKDIKKLSGYNSGSKKYMMATMLPGVSYFIDIPYQPARKLINANVPVALATDFNPGSCMTENMQIIMSLASLKLKMTVEEIINAVTYNSACALYLQDKIGSIETGKQADILIFDMKDYKELVYNFGVNRINYVIKKGQVIHKN